MNQGTLKAFLYAYVDHGTLRCLANEVISRTVPYYMILFVLEGRGMLEMNGTAHRLTKGRIFLCPPEQHVRLSAESPEQLNCKWVTFEAHRRNPAADEAALLEPMPEDELKLEPTDLKLVNGFATHLSALEKLGTGIEPLVWAKQQSILYELLGCLWQADEDVPLNSKESRRSLEELASWLRTHYAQSIGLQQLADLTGHSIVHFSRLFRQWSGRSPLDYVTNLRLNRSKELLLEGHWTLKEIAEQVGYADELYFSRLFKKRTGVPPTRYPTERPTRVAVAWSPLTYHLLALELTPCAALEDPIIPHRRQSGGKAYVSLGTDNAMDSKSEAIRKQQPELILSYDFQRGWREELRSVAPVAEIPWLSCDVFGQLRHIAALTGREAIAEAWIARYEAKAEAARRDLLQRLKAEDSWAIWMLYGDDVFRAYGNRNIGHVFYRSLGLRPPEAIAEHLADEANFVHVDINEARMEAYSGDHLLIMIAPGQTAAQHRLALLQSHSSWQRLKAVQLGQVHVLDVNAYLLYDPLSIEGQLADAVTAFNRFLQDENDRNVHVIKA